MNGVCGTILNHFLNSGSSASLPRLGSQPGDLVTPVVGDLQALFQVPRESGGDATDVITAAGRMSLMTYLWEPEPTTVAAMYRRNGSLLVQPSSVTIPWYHTLCGPQSSEGPTSDSHSRTLSVVNLLFKTFLQFSTTG